MDLEAPVTEDKEKISLSEHHSAFFQPEQSISKGYCLNRPLSPSTTESLKKNEINSENAGNVKDKKVNQTETKLLYDTGKFMSFSLGRGYIPDQSTKTQTKTETAESNHSGSLKFMPNGSNGEEGLPYYEVTYKI